MGDETMDGTFHFDFDGYEIEFRDDDGFAGVIHATSFRAVLDYEVDDTYGGVDGISVRGIEMCLSRPVSGGLRNELRWKPMPETDALIVAMRRGLDTREWHERFADALADHLADEGHSFRDLSADQRADYQAAAGY